MSKQSLTVVIGVIRSRQGDILIAERPASTSHAGFWEFPGGKVDMDETDEQALARELYEEVNIQINKPRFFTQNSYQYPDYHVTLKAYWVEDYIGHPQGAEGQKVKWIRPVELDNYPFPEANRPIIEAVSKLARA
jgi:8-oxo-dGTP diphosphatase